MQIVHYRKPIVKKFPLGMMWEKFIKRHINMRIFLFSISILKNFFLEFTIFFFLTLKLLITITL
jgi:hypothetical protein